MTDIKLGQSIAGSFQSIYINTLVVFDSRVSDIETLSKALLPGAMSFTIDAQDDGLEIITQLLAATGAKYLAIVAHGEPGVVHLGKNPLNIKQLQVQSQLLSEWNMKEIALYSCEVAQGDIGQDFIYQLSELTGAMVSAAATETGSRELGGNWDLNVTTGVIASPMLFETSILEYYQHVLPVSFGSATIFAIDSPSSVFNPSVTVGDFNGDGKLDLATVPDNGDNVFVLLGDGKGSFGSATSFALETRPDSVTTGDFNGDGKLDLATTNSSSVNEPFSISVLLNNSSTTSTTQVSLANFKQNPAKYMESIRDYDGNNLGGSSTWKAVGDIDINGDGTLENILVNPKIERFASVGAVGGNVDFTKYGLNGDTRVVGIYIDPTLKNSPEKIGGPFDSQRRFQNDLKIDNLQVLAAGDYNKDGFQDLYFRLGDGTAALRAEMFKDGNIKYANYQSKADLSAFMTSNNVSSSVWGSWI